MLDIPGEETEDNGPYEPYFQFLHSLKKDKLPLQNEKVLHGWKLLSFDFLEKPKKTPKPRRRGKQETSKKTPNAHKKVLLEN